MTVTFEVAAPPGETEGYVTKTAEEVQGNALPHGGEAIDGRQDNT